MPATSSTTTFGIYAVAIQTVASSATECLFTIIKPEQKWTTDVINDAVVNHAYQRMLLSDKDSVNNTGTDNTTKEAVFMQTGTSGALTGRRIVGKFLKVANVTA